MDKNQSHTRNHGTLPKDTVRMKNVDDSFSGNESTRDHTRVSNSERAQGQQINMEKLRRDLEASKLLHEEAKRNRQLAQERKRLAEKEQTLQQETAPESHEPAEPAHEPVSDATQQPINKASRARNKRQRIAHETAALKTAAREKKHDHTASKAVAKKVFKSRPVRWLARLLFTIFLIGCVLSAAFAGLWMFKAHNAPTPIENIPESERAAVAQERAQDNVYLLLAGTDQRADEASRSDTIIYTVLRPADRKIEMVSVPRDSLVTIDGYGEGKVNSALAYGGMELLVNTIENLVNTPIDHTVLLNFESFAKIIDAMGGITINVPEKMYLPEEGIDLEAGEQKLNGHDALAFVRWRGDGLGDIGRMQRQSEFMAAVSQKVQHLMPWQAVRTLWVASHEIDTDMSLFDMLRIGWSFIGMSSDALSYEHFEYEATYIDGVSYVILDDNSVNQVVQTMKYGIVLDDYSTGDGYSNTYGY